jgi:hypothetical protein
MEANLSSARRDPFLFHLRWVCCAVTLTVVVSPTTDAQEQRAAARAKHRDRPAAVTPEPTERVAPSDAPRTLRMRVETPEGVLVVFDATSPPQVGEGCSGYLAYWLPTPDLTPYVFPAVLDQKDDLGRALLALERDLGVDLEALAEMDDRVDSARNASAQAPNEEILWEPATLRRAVELMGFDPGDDSDLPDPGDAQTAAPCQPCSEILEPPSNCGSPGGLAQEALNVASGCCGGGGTPPDGDPGCVCCPLPAASEAEGSVSSPDGTGTVASCCVCYDGDPCTTDVCSNGACTFPPISGPQCWTDGNPCTNDVCVNGVCTHPPLTGPACDINDCWNNEHCVNGHCVGDWACDDGVWCTDDTCDFEFGEVCLPDYSWCYYCAHHARDAACNDSNVCTLDFCGPAGCAHTNLTGGTCRNDGNECTDDVCEQGACTHRPHGGSCASVDTCHQGSCINGGCVQVPINCDDNDPCTINDRCVNGVCFHDPMNCDDGDRCTADSCVNGVCVHGHSDCENGEDPCNPNPIVNHYPICATCQVTVSVPATVRVNCDDDDGNGVTDSQQTGPVAGENDLVPAYLSWSPGCAQMAGAGQGVVWRIAEGSGNRTYRAYRNPDKTGPVDSLSGYNPWPPPSMVWLEGVDPTEQCPSRVVVWVGVTYASGGFCIYCGYEGPPMTVEGATSATAEVIDQDVPTNTTWQTLAENSPVYGGSEASTADNLRLTVHPQGTVANVVWSVSGAGHGTWNAPPTGPSATTWDLGDLLDPIPGKVAFAADVRYVDGTHRCFNFETEIGVRTDDVIVVGWINPAGVGLPVVASEWLVEVMPPDGAVSSALDCNLYAFRLSENHDTGNDGQVLDDKDRNYTLYWMFKYAGNADPRSPSVVQGGDFRDTSDAHIDEAEVASFKAEKTNYKLFSRLQLKYTTGSLDVLKADTGIGETRNPCGPVFGSYPGRFTGQAGHVNGPPVNQFSTRLFLINDGSPDAGAIRAFNTLTGKSVPQGWTPTFWENIGSKITFERTGGSTAPTLVVQPYPTYYVYQNGRFANTFSQAATPKGNFWTNPYPFGTVECWGDGGLTPGGRCGNATSPADTSAQTPTYVLP